MKDQNKKYVRLGLTIFLSLCAVILFYYVIFYGESLSKAKDQVVRVLLPIIDGVVIAYVLSPLQNTFENKVWRPLFSKYNKNNKNRSKIIRILSTLFTVLVFLILIYVMILLIIPQVLDSLEIIIKRFPLYMEKMDSMIFGFLDQYPEVYEIADNYWPQIEEYLINNILPSTSSLITSLSTGVVGSVVGLVRVLFNFIIGIIISVYLLFSKELFCAQAKKVAYSFFSEETSNNLINNMRYANKTFGGFISGKIVDSIIIGIICFVCMSILKIPYSLLISVIVGITNVIPYFGPFLGAIPSALILLMINPMKCLVFLIFILILQQFDGNILGPKILGDSTGLSAFWVIFSITVFGGLFGVLGMFIGVPLFAVIYAAFKTFVNHRLEKKDLPVDTSYYLNSDYHSDKEEVNSGKEIKFAKKTFDKIVAEVRKKE